MQSSVSDVFGNVTGFLLFVSLIGLIYSNFHIIQLMTLFIYITVLILLIKINSC